MRVWLLLAAAALLLVGCSSAPPTPTKLYAQNCSGCHGPHGEGSPSGKPLVDNRWVQSLTDDQLVAFIRQGRSPSDPLNTSKMTMPPRGGNPSLSDDELHQIVSHIRTLQSAAHP